MSDGGSIPGWYPDPWQHEWLRWWDGRTWTTHLMAGPRAGVGQALAEERQALPWGRAAVIAWPLLLLLTSVNYVLAGHTFRLLYDWFRTTLHNTGTPGYVAPPAPHVSFYGYVGILLWLPKIAFAIWLWRSASTARAMGYHASLNPGLGGFSVLIPVVDLWMPAQCMMGCLPLDHPLRGRVPWFWALYDVAGFAAYGVIIAAAFSETAGFVCLVPLAAAYLVLFLAARRFVAAVERDHLAAATPVTTS
jgi:hypothetical protein